MPPLDLRDAFDIVVVAVAIYSLVVWLKRARAGLAAIGALAIGLLYLGAREMRLTLTAWLFQWLFPVLVVVLIVVLQNDLRRAFERLALWGLGKSRAMSEDSAVEILTDSVGEMVSRGWGALVVLPGRDAVERYIQGGVELDGKLSRALLASIFDPSSNGHDGAVVVEGGRVSRFAAHLPLSAKKLLHQGTRHSAALGLSEDTDALAVVVSEERGEVTLARDGKLITLDSHESGLREAIAEFLEEKHPNKRRDKAKVVLANPVELFLAPLLAFGLWFLLVSGERTVERQLRAKVVLENVPESYEVTASEPAEVTLTLSGLRRDLFLLDPTGVEVRLDATQVSAGRRYFEIDDSEIRLPPDVRAREVEPTTVKLTVQRIPAPPQPTEPAGPEIEPSGAF